MSAFAPYCVCPLQKASVAAFNFFKGSCSTGSIKIVRGLKAEKLLVVIENGVMFLQRSSRSVQKFSSITSSIQNGGIRVICAGDFKPTAQPQRSRMKVLKILISSFNA